LRFVGIDLAWSERNPSGVAVIGAQGVVQKASAALWTNDEICQFAGLDSSEGAVIAVDAPLVVKNVDGSRPVEQELTQIFWPYDANPYPANLSNPAFDENGRIQRLVRHLEGLGFVNRPIIPKRSEQHSFVEVFPSPAQVILFPGANRQSHLHVRALRYKRKKGRHKNKKDRSWTEVHSEWEIYRARLRSLGCREPRMTFSPEVNTQLGVDITGFEGPAYKQWDDLLDGIFCGYLAYYFWHRGEEGCWVVGKSATGAVTLPKCQLADCPLPIAPE